MAGNHPSDLVKNILKLFITPISGKSVYMCRHIKISGFHSLKVSLLLSLLIIIIIIIIVNNLCNYITMQIIPDNVLECVTLTY